MVLPPLLKSLPPVRRPVPVRRSRIPGDALLPYAAQNYECVLYRSGTDALAAALVAAKSLYPSAQPEAILPAYGCPDLVAACMYAGVRPRLVDTARGEWGYDMQVLDRSMTPGTIAIVAVNLLGLGDQVGALSEFARERSVRLIQDSAQFLPSPGESNWQGDDVVLSFGRGKPLNLLRGGALLTRRDGLPKASHVVDSPRRARAGLLTSPIAAVAFNLLTHSLVYGIASRLPRLHLGQSVFSPLKELLRADSKLERDLQAAYAEYRGEESYSAGRWSSVLADLQRQGVQQLAGEGGNTDQRLRLPLIARTQSDRDALVKRLCDAGVGASSLYAVPLNEIAGIPQIVAAQGPFPGASWLASRLLTLPTHQFVDEATVERVRTLLAC